MKIGLNSVKPGKIKKIIDEFNSIEEKQIKNENEKINLKKCNYIKKNDILSLTSRESYEYNRNKYNKNNKIITQMNYLKIKNMIKQKKIKKVQIK